MEHGEYRVPGLSSNTSPGFNEWLCGLNEISFGIFRTFLPKGENGTGS